MDTPLDLTFAEIEFLLRARPEQADEVRRNLLINPEVASDIVVAAGVASLLTRGLCEVSGASARPTGPLATVAAALSTSTTHVHVAIWSAEPPTIMHLYDGPFIRLAVFPITYGRFTVEPLDRAEDLSAPLIRVLGPFEALGGPLAVAVQARVGAETVSVAVARDETSAWSLSDTLDSPEAGRPSTREGVEARLIELFAAGRVAQG